MRSRLDHFRRHVSLGCIASLCALLGCQHVTRREPPPRWASGPVQWGEPVDGLQAGLARIVMVLKPGSGRSRTDAPAYIEFHLRNVGDRPIKFVQPQVWCNGRSPGRPLVEASLITRDRDAYRAGYLSASPKGLETVIELAPGEAHVVPGHFGGRLSLGPYMWGLASETEGQCRLSYHNRQSTAERWDGGDSGGGGVQTGLWVGDVETGPIPVTFDHRAETQMD